MSRKQFHVIIVGSSVTGLTLAHSLDRLGVDYTILERRAEIAPQEGASIGILPNGARVLDQLGLYDAVDEAAVPLGATQIRFPDGFSVNSAYPRKMLDNFGYPIAFLERRRLLEILHDALPDKSKVRVGKAVTSIEQLTDRETSRVRVRTVDGDAYEGDLVVGADGVRSRIRSEMWRLSGASRPDEIPESERKNMSVEYSCCFGISTGVPKLKAGEQVLHIDDGRSLAVIPSKNDIVFWFLVQKLDRKYLYGDAPRFTSEQAAEQCLRLQHAVIADDVHFGDVWERRRVFNMVALEENVIQTWFHGRVVCLGDSIHKMTVNLGQGANCAIEDVAVLSNLLRDCLDHRGAKKPTDREIEDMLRRFNHMHLPRVTQISDMSRLVARVHARDGFVRKVMGRYILPYLGGFSEGRAFHMIADAAALDFEPLPRTWCSGWEKYRSRGERASYSIVAVVVVLLVLGRTWMVWQGGIGE